MGRLQRAGTAVVLILFFGSLVVRPLLSNPGVSAAVDDGLFTWPTVLWLPVVGVSLLLVVARLWTMLGDDEQASPEWEGNPDQGTDSAEEHWGVVDGWDDERDEEQAASGGHERSGQSDENQIPPHTGALTPESERPSRPSRQRPTYRILGGTGGARDRSFDLEREPPEASLGDHLDHLRAELDDEEELAEFERVVAETETESPIPARCPQDHCNARWEERSILGLDTARYEVLDDGERVVCLECESITDLDS